MEDLICAGRRLFCLDPGVYYTVVGEDLVVWIKYVKDAKYYVDLGDGHGDVMSWEQLEELLG